METPGILNPISTPIESGQAPTPSPVMVRKFAFKGKTPMILGVVVVVLLGIGTGWLLSGKAGGKSGGISSSITVGENEAGILDESSFKGDAAEGTLKEEGINGEGTHHLEREGGVSQNVYLASTAIDLQAFVGKKVKVWGESQAVKKAGWFMDVVKIKVIE